MTTSRIVIMIGFIINADSQHKHWFQIVIQHVKNSNVHRKPPNNTHLWRSFSIARRLLLLCAKNIDPSANIYLIWLFANSLRIRFLRENFASSRHVRKICVFVWVYGYIRIIALIRCSFYGYVKKDNDLHFHSNLM